MALVALILGCLIDLYFAGGIAVYILASRAYSYRGIRLKKYPILGWLTVIICQGALIFFLVFYGSHHPGGDIQAPALGLIASSLLVGGFYPLTQIYQHEEDRRDHVRTLSLLLGYRGSFIFTGIVYGIAFATLTYYFLETLQIKEFYVLATCMLPVTVYFFIWAARVWKDTSQANFVNSMRMNLLASICINTEFVIIFLMH